MWSLRKRFCFPTFSERMSYRSTNPSLPITVINTALSEGLDGRSFVQQTSNAGIETRSPTLDGESKRTSSQAPYPAHHDYYGSAADHAMRQEPPFNVSHAGHTQQAGYGAAYSGSYHPNRSADSLGASPSISASPYGSTSDMEIYDSQPHASHYHDYTEAAPSGHMYNNRQTSYTSNNASSDISYYQSQGQAPSTVAYPASSAPYSAEYSSFAGARDPSGLERSASVPVDPINAHAYQPTPEKIAEAQKAAKFAVSALAFDDVATAVTYLKQSLELLTIPSSG